MFFSFGLKSASLLIFFVHAIVFSTLLLIRGLQDGNKSSYWLASFIFLCGMYIAPFMFGYAGWYAVEGYQDILFYTPFQQLFLMPPILYFYVRNLFHDSYAFRKKDWLHFVPAILYAIYSLIVWVTDQWVLNEYYFYADGKDKDLDLWYQVAGFVWMFLYLVMSLRLYRQYRKNTSETVSYADSILLPWVQRFLAAFLLLLLIRLLFFILNPEWANFGSKYWYYLSFSILFYYISISGYAHSVRMLIPLSRPLNFNQPLEQMLQIQEVDTTEEVVKTEKEAPSRVEYDVELKRNIEDLMKNEKVYKNPELTLFDIANSLNTHPKKVSQTINKGFDMNFNDFINRYRVLEVIDMVNSDQDQLKTLLGIALDAGFNSKSTFNRAFKKQTNTTPKEYFRKNRSE